MTDRSKVGLDSYLAGHDFQDDIAMAWAQVPKSWRMRIRDGGNGDRPADEIVVLNEFRLLVEAKRTKSMSFNLKSLVKENQINSGVCSFNISQYKSLNLFVNF